MALWISALVVLCSGYLVSLTSGKPGVEENPTNIHPLATFLRDNDFSGATVGVMRQDNLIYAEGQGKIRDHHAHARTILPALGFSKLLTAVAMLQLMEQEKLTLDDRVFGNHGILYYYRPEDRHKHKMDSRLMDITVRDLLYHTAGWEESEGPVYDPMMNALYVRKGYNTVNIAAEMKVFGILNHDDIIRYMVSQPLQYDPGSKRSESNFGYSLLGRIIEEVSDLPYEEYVTQMILKQAGMWHTRMGPARSNTRQSRYDSSQDPQSLGVEPGYIPLMGEGSMSSIFDAIPAQILDSCLGWHTNIFDLSRFFKALFKSGSVGILAPETVEALILEPAFREQGDSGDAWDGIGFTVNADGGVWFTAEHVEVGAHLVLYHQGPPLWLPGSKAEQDKDVSLFFMGVSDQPHPDLRENLASWLRDAHVVRDFLHEDSLAADLADDHVTVGSRDVYVRYKLSEHHLQSYTNALHQAGYTPTWIHGYPYEDTTNFVVISEKAQQPSDLDFALLVGHSKERFIHRIVEEIRNGFQLTFLQTYNSAAHDDRLCHVAIVRKLPKPVPVEFDIATDLDSYAMSEREGLRDGFIPAIQSVDVDEDNNDDVTVTYLMRQNPDGVGSVTQHDLSLEELKQAAEENADIGYTLAYLDTFFAHGEPRFSAIFHQGAPSHWMLQTDVTMVNLPQVMSDWQSLGYVPSLLGAYEMNGETHFVGLWTAVTQ